MFFHDKLGGDAIGVVFNPEAREPHAFRVPYSQDSFPVATCEAGEKERKKHPSNEKLTVALNVPAILHAFAVTGGELVKKIILN